ncbi:MAG: Trk system potassium transporter TrkA [Desulfobacteraceae bacterium]|nr:Trk system potassium transporter TrkA [Desulfobacteraceae bacterium]
MKIIIVGAGEVGYNIASKLSSENKKVVVIDKDPVAARRLSDDLDVQVMIASGSSPNVLLEAGIKDAEILLAVTDSDEANLVSCLVANMISPTTKKYARVRSADYDDYHENFKKDAPHIDTVINPEIAVVNTIRRLMSVPGAIDMGSFADGKVRFVGLRIDRNSPMANISLTEFPSLFKDTRPLISAIIRGDRVIVPRGGDKILPKDLVYFITETEKLNEIIEQFGKKIKPLNSVLIIGGGRIGLRLARLLEKESINIKIVDSDLERCEELAKKTEKAVILHGDASEKNLFLEENVSEIDVVVSLTNHDETNILVSLLAKEMGAHNTITKISKINYLPLMKTIGLDKVVSPRLSAATSILRGIRKGKVLSAISVFGEGAEFIEAVALKTSGITKKPLSKIAFPKGSILVCIIREDEIIIPSGESVVEPEDRIIIFTKTEDIQKLEKLLTVKLEFF